MTVAIPHKTLETHMTIGERRLRIEDVLRVARGEAGVAHMLATLRKEMEVALALTGVADAKTLGRDALA